MPCDKKKECDLATCDLATCEHPLLTHDEERLGALHLANKFSRADAAAVLTRWGPHVLRVVVQALEGGFTWNFVKTVLEEAGAVVLDFTLAHKASFGSLGSGLHVATDISDADTSLPEGVKPVGGFLNDVIAKLVSQLLPQLIQQFGPQILDAISKALVDAFKEKPVTAETFKVNLV